MLHVLGTACRDITFRVEILPRPGETLNARITYGGILFDLKTLGFGTKFGTRSKITMMSEGECAILAYSVSG